MLTIMPIPRAILIMMMMAYMVMETQPVASAQSPSSDEKSVRLVSDGRSDQDRAESTADAERVLQAAQELETQLRDLEERQRELRLDNLELRNASERAELEGRADRVRELQAALLDSEYQLQRTELDYERVSASWGREVERRELSRMTDRLEYVAGWRGVAFDPPQAVTMAIQSMVEQFAGSRDLEGGGARLEKILERVRDHGTRTALRFALQEIYTELGRTSEATEHLEKIILENSAVDHDHH